MSNCKEASVSSEHLEVKRTCLLYGQMFADGQKDLGWVPSVAVSQDLLVTLFDYRRTSCLVVVSNRHRSVQSNHDI